jgi:NADPH:quinone reductase-like Zn-dependent oxidoreductase
MILRAWFSRAKIVAFVANANRDDLALIGELLASGQLKSIIDRRHRLSEVPEAMRYQGTWRVRGKLVICVDAE